MIDLTPRAAPERPPLKIYAIHAAEASTAVLRCLRGPDDVLDVLSIHRLPPGLEPVAAALREAIPDLAPDLSTVVIIDADGLGQALHDHLQVRHRRGWRLFSERGRDRQALVNALLVAEQEHRIRIHPSPHSEAMRKALLGYRRTVADDGLIGAELVVALALACTIRRPVLPRVM